MNHLHQTFG